MRRGRNGLLALVGEKLKEDIRSGALLVFTNESRRLLKVLYWDHAGLWLVCERLEKGTFSWPRTAESGASKLKLTPEAFAMLTDGIDLRDGVRLAKEKGVLCSINPDAHSTGGLQDLWFGVRAARKGWLTRADVINCLPLDKVTAVLGRKRG